MWVASDIHMSAHAPATTQAFLDFLDQAAVQSDVLLLPGDIFDVWIGDDFALRDPPAWLTSILDALLKTSQYTRLYVGRGNRDFLMGDALAQRIGAQLLPDQVYAHTDIGTVILSHGDEYCISDRGYQRFRRLVRNRAIQRLFLCLSLKTRKAIAAWARQRSQRNNRNKSITIMDVDPSAIQATFRQSDSTLMVHGHTHRPAVHDLVVDGRDRQRIVLPDWDCDHTATPRKGWLVIDRDGPRLHQFPDPTSAATV